MVSSVMAVKYPATITNFSATDSNPKSYLILDKNKPNPVVINDTALNIVPGESKVQKETREKIEADAIAKQADQNTRLNVISRDRRVYSDPGSFETVYGAAAERFGVDARLLKAIHYVETGCSGSTSKRSFAGAIGPMQFLASTFNRHAVDGNGDGILDVTNLEDSIFSAAAYLRACGYPNIKSALHGYNPSSAYYRKVASVARSLGMNI